MNQLCFIEGGDILALPVRYRSNSGSALQEVQKKCAGICLANVNAD